MSGSAHDHRRVRRPPIAVAVLAALTYLPALSAAPGRMPTDTKLFLYLDPGRLVADAPFTWDTRQFAGWVPHQTIAYLWPSGPWFWTFDTLGMPDWIAHRLWLGTLLFLAGLGVRWAARHLGLDARSAAVAGAVYALSPYVLPYVSRTSVMLLPYMGLGWLVGLTVRATTRSRWRDVGWFGLVVLTIGAVNATALALVAPAPVLWLAHAAWQRSITWRTAIVTAVKLGTVSLLVSMWWIVMLVVQGRHGADVLAFSETLEAVSLTSVSTETLRGLGYWLFYVRDPYAFTTTAAIDHLGSVWIILAGYALVVLALAGLALVRWSQRRFVAWMFVAGIVLAVGVHPIDDPSPLMAPLEESALGLALRSSTRALPLSAFAVAIGAATLVTLATRVRVRGRDLGTVAAAGLVLLAVVGLPAATSGGYVDQALVRDQDVPAAWEEAVDVLDAGSSEYRVLQLPGSEFGAFRWGYTVDPPLPGLTDKPLVTRDLLPLGSPGAMDLLYALDNRFQAGTVDPASIAPIARLLGVDTIWVANDLAFDRFRTPRPELVSALFGERPPGLGTPRGFGTPTVNVNDIPMIDEQGITDARLGTPLPPVELVDVEDPLPIVRVLDEIVVVAGSGDGLVDAAAAGLLDGDEAVVYVADLGRWADAGLPDEAVPDDALVVITDSNRDRATQWRGSQDTTGLTEIGGAAPDALREDVADQRLDVFGPAAADTDAVDPAQQTVAVLDGGLVVRATGYGEPFAYRPEDRPAMAVDGDPATAWRVADRFDPRGEQLQVSTTDGQLRLVQQQRPEANRWITGVRITAGDEAAFDVALDERSRTLDGQVVEVAPGVPVTIEIVDVAPLAGGTDSGASAVGFAEIGPVARETVRVPVAAGALVDAERPVAIVLTRLRVRPTDRWRSDPEPALDRTFRLPVARTIDDVTVTLRRNDRAADPLVDALTSATGVELPAATSNRRLTGVPGAHAAAAFDEVLASAWITPFGQAVGSTITVTTTAPTTGPLTLVQPIETSISPIRQLTFTPAGGEPVVVDVGTGTDGAAVVDLPAALPAGELTIEISAVDSRTTVDRRWAEPVQLPAAIAELTGLELLPAPVADLSGCRTDLLHLDGLPVGVSVDARQLAALAAGEAVDVGLCDTAGTSAASGAPLGVLAAGDHRLVATTGLDTGIDVDRVVVRSGLTPGAPSSAAAPTVERSRTERTIVVDPCPDGCFVVLGEGFNDAWSAAVDGRAIGAPVQIGGGFNGWWLPPADTTRTVTMTWTPQRSLMIALGLSVLGVLASVALVVADRRRLDAGSPTSPPEPGRRSTPNDLVERESRRAALHAAGVLVVAAAVAVEPRWGVAALAPAAVVVVTRRPRLAALAAAAGVAFLGALVAWREYDQRFFLDASWPGHFEDLHRAGVFVVMLLLAGTLAHDRTDRGPDQDDAATPTSEPAR